MGDDHGETSEAGMKKNFKNPHPQGLETCDLQFVLPTGTVILAKSVSVSACIKWVKLYNHRTLLELDVKGVNESSHSCETVFQRTSEFPERFQGFHKCLYLNFILPGLKYILQKKLSEEVLYYKDSEQNLPSYLYRLSLNSIFLCYLVRKLMLGCVLFADLFYKIQYTHIQGKIC